MIIDKIKFKSRKKFEIHYYHIIFSSVSVFSSYLAIINKVIWNNHFIDWQTSKKLIANNYGTIKTIFLMSNSMNFCLIWKRNILHSSVSSSALYSLIQIIYQFSDNTKIFFVLFSKNSKFFTGVRKILNYQQYWLIDIRMLLSRYKFWYIYRYTY